MYNLKENNTGIYQILFGRDDIPISSEVDFTQRAQQTILITTFVLSATAILMMYIAKTYK